MAIKKTLKKKATVKKSAPKASAKKSNVTDNIMGSASEIWLAGLGAFAKAQQEGVKIFNKLVDEGKGVEKIIMKTTQSATKEVKENVGKVTNKASRSWDKLENIFETRVEKVLAKLDIPSSAEISALLDKIETLATEVSKLTGNYVADVKTVAKKVTKKTPTPKKAATTAKKEVKKVAKKVSNKAPTTKKVTKKATKSATTVKKVAKKVTKKTTAAVKKVTKK